MKKIIIILFISAITINAQVSRVVVGNFKSDFRLVRGSFTWEGAKESAESKGGHLATITSKAEQKQVETLVSQTGVDAWIGGEQNAEGSWRWVTGESWAFDNWDNNEPNGGSNEKHINIWGTNKNPNSMNQSGSIGKWNDFREHYALNYVLEKVSARIGIENPPLGKKFALMVSTDLKTWNVAKDSEGNKCIKMLKQEIEGKCVWWKLPKVEKAFYRISNSHLLRI